MGANLLFCLSKPNRGSIPSAGQAYSFGPSDLRVGVLPASLRAVLRPRLDGASIESRSFASLRMTNQIFLAQLRADGR